MPQAEREVESGVGILIVDDEAENRIALKEMLAAPEYRIVEASSGQEALRKLLEDEFAMLLVDVVLPGMDGFELAAAVKARARTAAIPILFLTGRATDVDQVYEGYHVGAVDYLTKPLMTEMVRTKVAVFAEMFRQRKRIERQAVRLIEAERKENDLRLVELRLANERRYRSLAEAVPHIVWTAWPDGRVDYFNRRWFEYTGIAYEEAGRSWQKAVHHEDLPRCLEKWMRALRSGEMFEAECRLRQSLGTYRWHLARAVPERGPTDQIVSWLGTFTDIEDQKRAEAVLTEFKGTLDAVLDAVLIFDPDDWRFMYVNHGASVLLGYSREDLLRMRPVDVLVEFDEAAFRELLAPLCDGSKMLITVETQIRRRDVRTVPVEVSLQLIRIDGGRVVSIARDVTDRRRAELERELLYQQAVDAIRARDEFLSVASHELRTPIAALHMQIETILRAHRKRGEAPHAADTTRAKMEIVERQVGRLSRLINELMDVSRITAGRLRLELEDVELSEIVRDAVTRHAEEAARAGSPVHLRAETSIHGRWDRLRLEQVVTNLLTNAVKFGAGRPIELSVEARGARARLTIRDHGIGIAPEEVERIFQRYEQAHPSRAYGGLGLGLFIVRQIVEAHGGTIRVESQPGAGSTFTVDLPREPARARRETDAAALHGEADQEPGLTDNEAHPEG
jgi:PAS domain S-box-containing protein